MSRLSDWYRVSAGHYWRGCREQIIRHSRALAHRAGQERAGWYYRRLKPTGAVVMGPYKTLRAAVKAAPKRRS